MSLSSRTAVILDCQPLWLEALHQLLERIDVEVLCKTSNPARALAAVGESKPDLLLAELDGFDDGFDTLDALGKAREAAPDVRVIVLSSDNDPARINEALSVGAVAYIVKTAHPDDIASAVRQVFEHSIFLAGTPTAAGATPLRPRQSEDCGLTRREIEILRYVSEGHSNAHLARMLWVTEQTVKFHLGNIYRKLDVKNRTEAGRWAQLHGLLDNAVERERVSSLA